MDYQALKLADAGLGIADPAQAAAALNAQVAAGVRDIPRRDARSILYVRGGYARMYRRIKFTTPPADGDTSAGAGLLRATYDAAVITLGVLDGDSLVIEAASAEEWAGVQAIFGLLVYMEDVSPGEQTLLLALRDVSTPVWPIVLTQHDIIAARSL